MSAWVYVFIAVGALLLIAVILVFNRMIRLRNKVRRAWKDIAVQLKLRHDLIPLLVSTAEGYALHEEQLLEKVTRLRAEAEASSGAQERGSRERSLSGALGEVFVLKEDYPGLKADTTFERLSRELVTVENHLAAARKYYNGSVRIYNTYIQSFPQLMLARLFFFRPSEYFQYEEDGLPPTV
ncbi:MAG: LemA family protein [Actinobacteria bacterium]|nr:LemA family protein [Actinomycetota bacterium]